MVLLLILFPTSQRKSRRFRLIWFSLKRLESLRTSQLPLATTLFGGNERFRSDVDLSEIRRPWSPGLFDRELRDAKLTGEEKNDNRLRKPDFECSNDGLHPLGRRRQ